VGAQGTICHELSGSNSRQIGDGRGEAKSVRERRECWMYGTLLSRANYDETSSVESFIDRKP
jgi:hypothetical protein